MVVNVSDKVADVEAGIDLIVQDILTSSNQAQFDEQRSVNNQYLRPNNGKIVSPGFGGATNSESSLLTLGLAHVRPPKVV